MLVTGVDVLDDGYGCLTRTNGVSDSSEGEGNTNFLSFG